MCPGAEALGVAGRPLADTPAPPAGTVSFLDALFAGEFTIERTERLCPGASPPAATRRRSKLVSRHVDLVQHDVRDLARIRQLETLPRLLAAAASQTARIQPAAPFEVSRPTIRDYLTLLEQRLPAWQNRLTRLVKRPKLLRYRNGPALAHDRTLSASSSRRTCSRNSGGRRAGTTSACPGQGRCRSPSSSSAALR